jgi:hypothetical protein
MNKLQRNYQIAQTAGSSRAELGIVSFFSSMLTLLSVFKGVPMWKHFSTAHFTCGQNYWFLGLVSLQVIL